MKTSIFFLALLVGFIFPRTSYGETGFIPDSKMEVRQSTSEQAISRISAETNPRKKVKKKRKTILNRKTKMKNGHSCPSF